MKNALIGILAFGIGWLTVQGAFYVLRDDTPASPSQMPAQNYIDRATTNCSSTGELSAMECRCMYTKMVNTYGVAETYRLDLEVSRDPNFVYPEEVLQIATDCMIGETI